MTQSLAIPRVIPNDWKRLDLIINKIKFHLGSASSPIFTGITLSNTGLHLLDTDASHDLIIAPGSNLTADRTLTLTTGDSDRIITLSGNPTLDDWFDQSVKVAASPTFANLSLGTGELTAGSINRGAGTLTLEIAGTAEISITSTTVTLGGNLIIPDAGEIGSVSDTNAITISATGEIDITAHDLATTGLKLAGTLITSSAAELNLLDGITAVQEQGDVLDDLNATGANTFTGDPINDFLVGTAAGTLVWQYGATARTSLGLTIGTNVQAFSEALKDLDEAGTVTDDGYFLVGTGAGVLNWETTTTVRTSIGLGTGDSPQFTGIELGHVSDTTITRVSAGVIAVEGVTVMMVGGAPTAHLHDGDTLEHDGVNSSAGAFSFTTAGIVTFNSGVTLGAGADLTIAGHIIFNTNNSYVGFTDPRITFNDTANQLDITGKLVLPDSGYLGSTSATTALQILPAGDILLSHSLYTDAGLYLLERAATVGAVATWGHIWVKNDTPNTLWFTDDGGADVQLGAGVAAHAMLDGSVHNDSVADPVTRGSLIYGNTTPNWDELDISTGFLRGDGTDCAWLSYANSLAAMSGTAGAAFSFNDQNITNVGSIAVDSIVSDGAAAALTITATAGQAVTIEGVSFDGGVVSGMGTLGCGVITQSGTTLANTYQPLDTGLTNLAALGYVSDSMIKITAEDTYEIRTLAQVLSDIGGQASGNYITALTGEVTASGPGSVAATIAANAVTYAKIQNVSATNKVLGRATAGAGVVEEIACTAAGRTILAGADAAAQKTTLSLNLVENTALSTWAGTTNITTLGTITTVGNITIANNGTIGQAAGPLLTFDDTANGLTVTGGYLKVQNDSHALLYFDSGSGAGAASSILSFAHNGASYWGFGKATTHHLIIDRPGVGIVFTCDINTHHFNLGSLSPVTRLTVEGTITLKEQAAADGDTAAYGQIWVKSDAPNILMYTDDEGNDFTIDVTAV